MMDSRTYRPVDRFIYAGLTIYLGIHFLGDTSNHLNRLFRNPGVALLMLILTQVLFPRFRASGFANVLTIIIIIAITVHALTQLDHLFL